MKRKLTIMIVIISLCILGVFYKLTASFATERDTSDEKFDKTLSEKTSDTSDDIVYDNVYVVSQTGNYSGIENVVGKYTSINEAVKDAKEGTVIYVKSGTYYESLDISKSGTKDKPIKIVGYEENGKKPVLDGSKLTKTSGSSPMIKIEDQNNIIVDSFEICNNISKKKELSIGVLIRGKSSDIYIQNCDIHDISANYGVSTSGNAHGIEVSGTTDTVITNINILNNEVHNLELGQSESVIVKGNVDGVKVNYNIIHDNDNIGIDFAGYEQNCDNEKYDMARNCECIGNRVYNIQGKKNPTYATSCADGIYVDGGRDILIKDNIVYNCDIGIEAASEHKGKAAENIIIKNNLVYKCLGYAGICLGGSSDENGTATGIIAEYNTVYDNCIDLAIQQANSSTNIIRYNVFARSDDDINIYVKDSIINKTKNVIENNIFTNGQDFTASLLNKNKIADVQFEDVLTEKFNIVDKNYSTYGYKAVTNKKTETECKEEIDNKKEIAGKEELAASVAELKKVLATEKPFLKKYEIKKCNIIVDGNAVDWNDYSSLAASGKINYIKAVCDEEYIYFCAECSRLGKNNQLFINLDNKASTGYASKSFSNTGYEYLIENGRLYKSESSRWKWKYIGKNGVKIVKKSSVYEIRIDKKIVNIGKNFGFAFVTLDSDYNRLYKVEAKL